MSKPEIQKVHEPGKLKLPIFDELDEVADRIRVRAYNLFRGRGFSAGHDLDDWLTAEREICWPAAELIEKDDEFEAKVALAGFEPEEIVVTATPKELIVKASHEVEKQEDKDDEDSRVRWSEFRSDQVYRRIALPSPIDVEKVEAEMQRGMLEIEAPKVVEKKPAKKKIKVKKAK